MRSFVILISLFAVGCMERKGPPAPVSMRSSAFPNTSQLNLPYVIVKSGESVGSLAKRHKVKVQDIVYLNRLKKPYHVLIGQKIYLPQKMGEEPYRAKLLATVNSQSKKTFYSEPPKPGQIKSVPLEDSTESQPKTLSEEKPLALNALQTDQSAMPLPKKIDQVGQKPSPTLPIAKKIEEDPETVAERKFLQVDPVVKDKLPAPEKLEKKEPTPKKEAPIIVEKAQPISSKMDEAITTDKGADTKKAKGESFAWPLQGKILKGYGKQATGFQNDGINIEAAEGDAIHSAADGIIAYVGNELQGFGNLVMVKHHSGWMSAYAHCSETLVKRGDKVKRGQTLAKVGHSGSVRTPQLHFELRKKTKAVDPIIYLE